VLDRFHITMHVNQAVDQVRRGESTRLRAAGKKERLKHMRWILLRRGSRVRGRARQKLQALLSSKLATARPDALWATVRAQIACAVAAQSPRAYTLSSPARYSPPSRPCGPHLPGSIDSSMKAWRQAAEALSMRRSRIRPMPFPLSSQATATKAFASVWRPRTPSSNPPM